MPEISRFLGIVIRMHYLEHGPPHFHAEYGDYEISVEIESGVVTGRFPRRGLKEVLRWYDLHREELMRNWDAARREKPLGKIEPLKP